MVIAIMLLSAFGPYIAFGIRTDQVVVYALAPVLLLLRFTKLRATVWQLGAVASWSLFAVFVAISTLTGTQPVSGSIVSEVDNILLPIAVSIIVLCCVTPDNRLHLLRVASAIIIIAACINVAIALLQINLGLEFTSAWLPLREESTATRAATLGRYVGIMNQPALTGVFYGMALILSSWLLRRRPWLVSAIFVWLLIGGVITLSKAFLFVALPIAFVILLVIGRQRVLAPMALFGTVTFALYTYRDSVTVWLSSVFPQWSGLDRMAGLFGSLDFAAITGNRFEDDRAGAIIWDRVMADSPLAGFGAGGLDQLPYDSAWIMALLMGGIVGLGAVIATALVFVFGHLSYRSRRDPTEWWSLAGVIAVLVVSAWGFPVFSGDRLAVLVWVVVLIALGPPLDARSGGIDPRRAAVPDRLSEGRVEVLEPGHHPGGALSRRP